MTNYGRFSRKVEKSVRRRRICKKQMESFEYRVEIHVDALQLSIKYQIEECDNIVRGCLFVHGCSDLK